MKTERERERDWSEQRSLGITRDEISGGETGVSYLVLDFTRECFYCLFCSGGDDLQEQLESVCRVDLLQTGEVGEEAVDVGEDGSQETCSSLRIFSSSGFC